MPLTASGKKILTKFKKEYGAKAGEKYFYGKMKDDPTRTKKWHKR